LFIIDGHSSHITHAFVKFYIEHNIILLYLPSYCTHFLQPLDVGLFSPYDYFYGLAIDNHMWSGWKTGDGIKKAIFLSFITCNMCILCSGNCILFMLIFSLLCYFVCSCLY
ncbi:hypothetical protein L873DRAFT_1720237, partial [Choiromyces venosus 120613-1]